MSPRLSSFLDAARWIAALMVVLGHVRQLFLADKAALPHLSLPLKALYAVMNHGHEAVVVFFVISGFLVGGLSIRKIREGRFSFRDYAAARFSRIYVVLVPALLVGGGLDLIGLHWADWGGLYSTRSPLGDGSLSFAAPIADGLNIPTLLGNLLMLEDFAIARLGSNGPLWSLVYEWWYYVLFAAGVLALTGRSLLWRVAGGSLLVLGICLLPPALTLWGTLWLLGAGAALYASSKLPKPPVWLGVLAGALALGIYRHLHTADMQMAGLSWPSFASDLCIAIGFCLLTTSFAKIGAALPAARLHRWAADFSYSVYLAHFPFALLASTIVVHHFGLKLAGAPSPLAVALMSCVLALTLAYCFAFSQVTEVYTPKVRELLLQAFKARPRALRTSQVESSS